MPSPYENQINVVRLSILQNILKAQETIKASGEGEPVAENKLAAAVVIYQKAHGVLDL